jgi:hypothetical protein
VHPNQLARLSPSSSDPSRNLCMPHLSDSASNHRGRPANEPTCFLPVQVRLKDWPLGHVAVLSPISSQEQLTLTDEDTLWHRHKQRVCQNLR